MKNGSSSGSSGVWFNLKSWQQHQRDAAAIVKVPGNTSFRRDQST